MKGLLKKSAVIAMAVMMMMVFSLAQAESITFTGTVKSSATSTVTVPAGGSVSSISVKVGDKLKKGDLLFTLDTQKVYADESGTVHYFGSIGDEATTVAEKNGAVAYVEPDLKYSISASTRNAYDAEENKWVISGETVYIKTVSTPSRTGTGYVSTVNGSNYEVKVTEGEFNLNESVNVYRAEDFAQSSRIGKGNISRIAAKAYTGSGSIVKFNMENGSHVERGDLLFETLDGQFDNLISTGDKVVMPENGVIASVDVTGNATVAKGTTAVTYYPENAVCVEAEMSESDLPYVSEGDIVEVEFSTGYIAPIKVEGTVARISYVGSAASENDDTKFTVEISIDSFDSLRYGMTADITTIDTVD